MNIIIIILLFLLQLLLSLLHFYEYEADLGEESPPLPVP